MKEYIIVAGARPNLMKIAPLARELDDWGLPYKVFHSGQHYDWNMNGVFEKQFRIKNIYHHKRREDNPIKNIQETITAFDGFLGKQKDVRMVVIPGDVNTSYACALAATKHLLPIAHLEAGLRSFDISMPEELHRLTIDHLSTIHLAPSEDAVENLEKEGLKNDVYMVGNIMIDSLHEILDKVEPPKIKGKYLLLTIHRPENIDNHIRLMNILEQLERVSEDFEVIFPIHPHTKECLEKFGLMRYLDNFKAIEPLGYLDFISYMRDAEVVITDSGGVQEETTFLGVRCLTVRSSTERPITVKEGTNRLVNPLGLASAIQGLEKPLIGKVPKYWDGFTAPRIVNILQRWEKS